jgi:DNA (cytosine-5)-methyltransferase 1
MPRRRTTSNNSSYVSINKGLGITDAPDWADRFGQAIAAWSKKSVLRPIRTLSLFSGAGGLDIGFHDAGFRIDAMIELDQRCVTTLEANSGPKGYFGTTQPIRQDIRKYRVPKDMVIDFIIGGPPCQPFSAAGRRMAGVRGTRDKQGALFRQYVRLLKKLSPQGFLFENVYGLIGAQKGRAWASIRRAFEEAGYHVAYRVLDAADYGVPQHRKRVFIVGTKSGQYAFPRPTHGPDSPGGQPYICAARPLQGLRPTRAEAPREINGRYGDLLRDIPPGLNYSFYTDKMGHPRPVFAWRSKFYDFLYKADPQAPIRTLTAHGGHYTGPFHWNNRRFTSSELKRLQTVPDRYKLVGGREEIKRQIGNSVPPQLARILALSILNQVFGYELPFDLPLQTDNQSVDIKQRKPLLNTATGRQAQEKIKRLRRDHIHRKPRKRTYTALLSDGFEWKTNPQQSSALLVSFTPDEAEWRVDVSKQLELTDGGFQIAITPRSDASWSLATPLVTLRGNSVDFEVFTGVWKAFEAELLQLRLKADLVQLNGYYQYPTAFQCTMSFDNAIHNRRKWRVVSQVVAGVGVGKVFAYKKLAALWGVSENRVLHYALWLRHLGYEVRNSNTNPQLEAKHLLIPYTFPTLNPMSVQLHRNLREIYAKA